MQVHHDQYGSPYMVGMTGQVIWLPNGQPKMGTMDGMIYVIDVGNHWQPVCLDPNAQGQSQQTGQPVHHVQSAQPRAIPPQVARNRQPQHTQPQHYYQPVNQYQPPTKADPRLNGAGKGRVVNGAPINANVGAGTVAAQMSQTPLRQAHSATAGEQVYNASYIPESSQSSYVPDLEVISSAVSQLKEKTAEPETTASKVYSVTDYMLSLMTGETYDYEHDTKSFRKAVQLLTITSDKRQKELRVMSDKHNLYTNTPQSQPKEFATLPEVEVRLASEEIKEESVTSDCVKWDHYLLNDFLTVNWPGADLSSLESKHQNIVLLFDHLKEALKGDDISFSTRVEIRSVTNFLTNLANIYLNQILGVHSVTLDNIVEEASDLIEYTSNGDIEGLTRQDLSQLWKHLLSTLSIHEADPSSVSDMEEVQPLLNCKLYIAEIEEASSALGLTPKLKLFSSEPKVVIASAAFNKQLYDELLSVIEAESNYVILRFKDGDFAAYRGVDCWMVSDTINITL